jgi:uncharacterized protein (TIGR00369 family)
MNAALKPLSESLVAMLTDSFARQGALAAWGAQLRLQEPGRVEIAVTMSPAVTQQHGYFHGGVIGTLADVAGGYAANTLLMPAHECLTAEYKINIVAPGVGQTLLARGKVIKLGKSLVVAGADVFAVDRGVEKLCAVMQQTLFVIPRKPLDS